MKLLSPLTILSAFTVCAIPRAEAVAMTYGDLGSFLTAAGSPLALEGFESSPAGNQLDAPALLFPGFEVTHSFAPDLELGIFNVPLAGISATGGLNFLVYQSSIDAELIFRFLTPINAFSLDLSDWGDYQQGPGTLGFESDAGHALTIANGPRANGNQLFFGIIDTAASFTEVRLKNSLPGEGFGVDSVRYGFIAPPPPVSVPDGGATWILLGCGTAGLGLAGRFSRRSRRGA